MGLCIRKLATTCHVPRRFRNEASVVDLFAHGRFAADLGGHLGPSFSRQPAVVRIRHLPIRVIIPSSDLNEASLSRAWTEAFARALFTALAYPEGVGPFEVFRADSVAIFIAGAIRDLLDGTAIGKWQYAEFEELFRSGAGVSSISLLTNWPQLTLPILLELGHSGALNELLPRLDDLALERLFVALVPPSDSEPPPLSIADLIAAAKLVLRHPPQKRSALGTRTFALQLYVYARGANEPGRSPRAIFHSLLALVILLSGDLSFLSQVAPRGADAKHVPPAVTALLQAIANEARSAPQSPHISHLRQLLSDLHSALRIPSPAADSVPARWISSDWCGLFFLSSTLDHLGWIPAWRQVPGFQSGGISPVLAGLSLAAIGKFESPIKELDPGVALFSGYLTDPDLSHLRRVFQEYPLEVRRSVMRAALGDEEATDTWARAFERLAENLLRIFALRVRGLQQSAPPSIVRMFLRRSGRIRIEEERILVQPDPSPFHVALHIAGMDAPVDSVSWLGDRRLEFEIGEI